MRVMGLDVGTKRIGVAVSDELMLTAQGRATIERKSLDSDLSHIDDLIKNNNISEVIVGLPLNMDGTYSAKTKEVIEFLDHLLKILKIPVKTWDERLTSVQAERVLLEADLSRRKRKRLSDKLAAQVILQSYLDSQKKGETHA
ncbi:MAG: Holliday junction resolvase RuvX [Candidatus Omnitrophica bacterium]|nr:Holliday junction resolvase RuvX [Candidatus Omnitrophota bacterium]